MSLKRSLAVVLLAAFAAAASAQLRGIPQDTKAGEMRHLQEMTVSIDDKAMRLAPGAQIRDAANRIVVPAALPPGAKVKYQLDRAGMVSRVWILSPDEAAAESRRNGDPKQNPKQDAP